MADVATLVFDIDSSGAAGAAKALAGLNRYAASTATVMAKLEKQGRNSNGAFISQTEYVAQNEAEIRRLASSYNLTLSAQLRFAEAQKDVARAVQLGVISADRQADVLRELRAQYSTSAAAAGSFAKQQGAAGMQTANVFAQLNDIGVMLAAGQNPIQLALQQGTQLNQVWASMGAQGRTLGGVAGMIRGAFASMISPMSLLTIGVIAGAGALVNWATSSDDSSKKAKTLSDSLSNLSSAHSSLKSSVELVNSPMLKLYERFGPAAAEVRDLAVAQTRLNIAVTRGRLSESIGGLSESMAKYTSATSALRSESSAAWKAIEKDIGLTGEQASEFVTRLREIDKETSTALRIEKFQQMVRWLEAAGVATDKLPVAFASAAAGVIDLNIQNKEAERLIQEALAAAGKLPGAFDVAARSASRIADALNAATSAAARLAAAGVSDARYAQIELDFRTDKVGRAAAIAAAKFDSEVGKAGMDQGLFNRMRNQAIEGAKEAARIMGEVERLNDADRKAESDAKKSATAGSRELKAAEKQFQSLRELLEKESVFQVAEWEKRQGQLQNSLNKRLITMQQFQEMEAQLKTYYFGTEFEKRQLEYDLSLEQLRKHLEAEQITRRQYDIKAGNLHSQKVTELGNQDANRYSNDLGNLAKHMGEMNTIAGGGYDSLLKAQRVFGAASALISTYTGAAEALKLPFPYNLAAAGKIIAAGMGFVNAIKGGGSDGGAASSASTATAAAKQEPTRTTLVKLEGDEWLVNLADSLITQIQDASKDGRMIVMRDY